MAESGSNWEHGCEKESRGGGRPLQDTHSPDVLPNSLGTKRHLPRRIVIQLTGTEGEWSSLDESELIFSLDRDEDSPSVSHSSQKQLSSDHDRGSQAFHVPLSPSSPSSLGNCSTTGPCYLSPGPSSPTHRPLASLVKSLSTELELREGSTLRPKPLLSLVKSISTELSRSEPEVSQSKSDSRLNLHLLKQLTQPKTRSSGDSRTAPPSPSTLSPSGEGLKGGFFKMELEDTKRKLSEAVHEPLSSMFNKIMREDSMGSPKHQSKTTQVISRGLGRESSTDTVVSESPVRSSGRTEGDIFDWPSVRYPGRNPRSTCPVHHCKHIRDEEQGLYSDGDIMQVFPVDTPQQTRRLPRVAPPPLRTYPLHPPNPPPCMSLFCVATLFYGYFTLPLNPYFSGMALGLALGFLLGLLLIRMGSSRSRTALALLGEGILRDTSTEPEITKGWMNEIHDYDPETSHSVQTHSVFATLEGSCLRLDTPQSNISRRATYDERVHESTFIKTRSYQLEESKVFLLPSVLARKRIWNPKYPICIQLASNSQKDTGQRLDGSQEAEQPGAEPRSSSSSEPTRDPCTTLYLFGRTGREKEEWFRHFLLASVNAEREKDHNKPKPGRCVPRSGDPVLSQSISGHGDIPCSRDSTSRVGSSGDDAPTTPPVSSTPAAPLSHASGSTTRGLSLLDYPEYMSRLLATEDLPPLSSPGVGSTETSPNLKGNCTCDLAEYCGRSSTAWVNALIGRIFWDFLREKHWADVVSCKIQKKLSKIRLPYFMNELALTELDMGCSMPQITSTSRPEVNHRGLWVELQLAYNGTLQMTLQTKFNLSKLGKEGGQDTDWLTENGSTRPILSVLADSDEESSSAGSSDEEELLLSELQGPAGEKGPTSGPEGTGGGRTGRKILRFVDKIAKSKYFQKAAENEFIKKKFEEMSNTPLLLTVEVQELSGSVVVNIPPPPTDRIWYSFCAPPKLDLHVRPKLGEREVTLCHVTEWIEKKLQDEFQKVFVLPNMDDIYLPIMHSGVDSPCASPQSSTESIERNAFEVTATEPDCSTTTFK
ncbi:testis-expressed protein 2 isoform X2 [Dunckerocampus dactyliophorus]|uniref:testis-expressed protein 2 isoform X2 n=1 Tax=Dunckerocampus dactyliophorus TaxID=161453 RepID=UPI0024071698|nr:testis-expressed protein 2 isoform X2 [Dunckerocampus dactyliophorus]